MTRLENCALCAASGQVQAWIAVSRDDRSVLMRDDNLRREFFALRTASDLLRSPAISVMTDDRTAISSSSDNDIIPRFHRCSFSCRPLGQRKNH